MKKILAGMVVTVAAVAMLAGCGKATTEVTVEESNVVSPVVNALEKYDPIISNLKAGEYYGFAAAGKGYDVLLVTDGVYDWEDGIKASINAIVYGLDNDGNVIELGPVNSSGTAYPLSVYADQYLMYGGNHFMFMSYADGGSIINKKYAEEVFDTDGNATYYLLDAEKQFEGEVDDDSELVKMYEAFGESVVVNFNPSAATAEAGADEAAAEETADVSGIVGTYVHEYEDEIGGDVVQIRDTIELKDDNTCVLDFQDTIPGTWTDTEIVMDGGYAYKYTIEGNTLNLDMDGLVIAFEKE